MKKSLLVLAMFAMSSAAGAASLHGSTAAVGPAGSAIFTVDANCEIAQNIAGFGPGGALQFGVAVPNTGPQFNATAGATGKVICTNTTPFAISVSRSLDLKTNPANGTPILYALDFSGPGGIAVPTTPPPGNPTSPAAPGAFSVATGTGTGLGFSGLGTTIDIPFRGTVLPAAYLNAIPGDYSDATLVMTVKW